MAILFCMVMLLVAIGLSNTTKHLAKLLLFSFLLAFLVCALDDDIKSWAGVFSLDVILISLIYSFPVAGLIQIAYKLRLLILSQR